MLIHIIIDKLKKEFFELLELAISTNSIDI